MADGFVDFDAGGRHIIILSYFRLKTGTNGVNNG